MGVPATKKRKVIAGRPAQSTTLFADEVFWASTVVTLTGGTVAQVISRLARDGLRSLIRKQGLDPDEAWKKFEAASRN